MEFKKKKEIKPNINMTSLIDVVLLLLIFFMISTTFVTVPGIKVKLPKAVTSEATQGKELVVTLTKDGQIYINNQKTTIPELSSKLIELTKDSKEHILIVKADKEVLHGEVVAVMDIAKRTGVNRLAIATEPKKE